MRRLGVLVASACCLLGATGCGSAAKPKPAASAATAATAAMPGKAEHAAKKAAPARGIAPLPLRAPQPGPKVRTRVPILMYHVVSQAPAGTAYPALWVSAGDFAAQMRALRSAGYEAVTFQRVWDAWHGKDTLPPKPIVLSFDDGYLSQYTHAAKILRPLGWPGVLNLKVDDIGSGGLTTYEVKAMHAAGWEIDAHTITHPNLTLVSAKQLTHEVTGSRVALQHRFDVPVRFFCYPAGRFDAAAEAAVKKAGYLAATTTQYGLTGPGLDPDAQPRVRVNAGVSPSALLSLIRSAPLTPEGAGGE